MLEPKKMACSALAVAPDTTLFYTGPSLDKGPMAALFYFALSAEDSLCLDPYNQPALFISDYPIRVFSLTLPGHEAKLPPTNAINLWAEDIAKGKNIIAEFVDKGLECITFLLNQKLTTENKIAAAGLSRGGFAAAHLAAREPRISSLLGFAPLTKLSYAKEFHNSKDNTLVQQLDSINLAEALYDRNIRFYIGNRDTRVGTRNCFDFFEALTEAAYTKNIRSPQIEMLSFPSIGHMGHGTGPKTFKHGIEWIAECLLNP